MGTPSALELRPRTVRFVRAQVQQVSPERSRAVVELEGRAGERQQGTSERPASRGGELRCVAEAAVDALRRALGLPENRLSVHEVETLDTFGQDTVLVSLAADHGAGPLPLLGICWSVGIRFGRRPWPC